ncbi:MAG: glycosyl hydrolase, partial [Gemmatimonadota bacterium]
HLLDIHREVNPYPWFYSGEPSEDIRERWQWTFPIIFSPVDHKTLYVSSQHLWSTDDGGKTWKKLSGDLTRHDPKTMGPSGGPITHDMNGPEVYATIFSVGPGKKNMDVIWAGSDDGLVHVTRDGGETWTDVTPPGMPDFGRVSQIDASSFNDGAAYVAVKRPLLNDKAPYIFRTRDYGQTWTKTVNGIPADDYVHAVREDPDRQGLLYAATQHGVYLSYDDGDSWQDLTLNMPDLPVVDLVVEKNQLVIASHGRGFWVLDNLAPIRQATPGMEMADAKMFTPPVAVRSGPDITLSWWLKDAPSEAKLEVLDSTGAVLRTFIPDTATADTSAAAAPSYFRRGPQWLPVEAGLNTLRWDLRAEPFVSFPGMIFWGARTTGPAVPPGHYTVRLTADGHSVSAPLMVERNPWITDVTDADLQAQYAFSSKVRDRVNDANRAVIAIRRVKSQLDDRYEKSDDATLHQKGDKLLADASDVEQDIYQVKNQSNQDPLNFPIRVNNRLANLMAMAERGDGRPTTNMPEIFRILSDQLQGYQDRLDEIWATDLKDVNEELARLGLTPLDPKCDEAGGCRPVM